MRVAAARVNGRSVPPQPRITAAEAVAVVPQRREEGKGMEVMTLLPLYEVDVPIRNTASLRGVHV